MSHARSNCSWVGEYTSFKIADLVGVQRPLAVVAEHPGPLAELPEAVELADLQEGPSMTCSPLARPAIRIFENT